MPSTRDIRRRIKSVRSTAQITKAMQMVASSKMARAQQVAVASRPFERLAEQVVAHARAGAQDFTHPWIEEREVRKRALIVVATDKGLCGALNTNLFREVARYEAATTPCIAVGRKAAQYLARSRRKLVAEFGYHDTPTFGEALAVAQCAWELHATAEVDEVHILYTRFVNTLSQRPDVRTLLPMGRMKAEPGAEVAPPPVEFLFEPNAGTVLAGMLKYLLVFEVLQVLLEAKASEHSARMVAMKSATDNANQLVKDLTLEYNKIRQATITKELLEISSAQMALG